MSPRVGTVPAYLKLARIMPLHDPCQPDASKNRASRPTRNSASRPMRVSAAVCGDAHGPDVIASVVCESIEQGEVRAAQGEARSQPATLSGWPSAVCEGDR